jgi:UDP:flavonoid glycosyltransferase YjiC (YdhE family)
MIRRNNLTADALAAAINRAVHDQTMRDRAAALGEKIRSENGVAKAVEIFQQTVNERL